MANGSDAVAPDMLLLGFLFTTPICENKHPLHQKMQTAMRQTPSRDEYVPELNHEQLVDNQLGLVGLVPGYTPPSQKKVPLPLIC